MENTATRAVVTELGRRLAEKLISSAAALQIVSAELGDGELSPNMAPEAMTALVHYVMNAPISDAGNPDTGQVKVNLQVLPTDVINPFSAKEAALFAMDPDDGKILYAYIPMQADPTELGPPKNGVGKILLLEVSLPILNVGRVNVSLSPDALISRSTFEAAMQMKADLVNDKVPADQLPDMDYEAAGAVSGHNSDTGSHPDIREAVRNAQAAADAALETITQIAHTIDVVPTQSGSLTYNGGAQSPAWNSYNPEVMTIGGVTTGANAGTYTATFKPKEGYTWKGGDSAAKSVAWSIGRATIAAVPSPTGSLTYTGTAQSPAWSGYNSAQLTIGGTSSATNAGTYSTFFTPTANYRWADGMTAAKSAGWSIAKAAGSLSLSTSAMNLTNGALTGIIAVTRAGNGAVSAVSSNTGVATVGVSGTTVTATGKAYGSATITVSVAAGSNHNAPAAKTCSVTVKLYNTTLASNTWGQIGEASSLRTAASLWSVGDTKRITINGAVGNYTFSNVTVAAFILGFDHNSNREGANKIHFQIGKINKKLVVLCDNNCSKSVSTTGYFSANATNVNRGGWNGSYMRKTLLGNTNIPNSPLPGSLMAALPSDLRAAMKPCTKYSDNTGGGSDAASYVTATTDYLWLLAELEYHGARTNANSAERNYQAQYDYYKAGNSKVHYKHTDTNTAVYMYCRSVDSNWNTNFCCVDVGGNASTSFANYSHGIAPAFCV